MPWKQVIDLLKQQNPIEVLKHPQANPQATVLVLGMLVVLALILISLLVLIYLIIESFRPSKAPKEIKIKEKVPWQTRLIELGIVAFIALILFSVSLSYTSQPSLCNSCHVMKRDYRSWKESSHKDVGCLACHNKPGIIGYFIGKTELLREALSYAKKSYQGPIKANVSNESCLSCHRDITRGIATSLGIRVSHKEILAGGYLCTDCHNTVAHGKVVALAKFPTMDKCVVCHKGKSASAKCSTCHVKDIGKQVRRPKREFTKVRLAEITNCRGCHPIEKCTQCHGTEMPHQPEWMGKRTHAREAAFEKKQVCLKFCHDLNQFCNRCHMFSGFYGHYAGWKQDHGRAGSPDTAVLEKGCMGCHTPDKSPVFCGLCH